ncbi:MAG: asparagine synthase (glutamine-hydrolyzing) [Coriobacteriia bacterium]|nr:asparagine synthase (glutamine-hydrolyzing) [Coriobacteriia bacterium]
MCGFVGFIGDTNDRDAVLDAMSTSIAHRGPDDQATFTDDYLALAFRRLSIIDLEGGSQPIFNADNTKLIVFNGEIYNYRELRTELEALGYRFRTNTDVETVLAGYEAYGWDVLTKLRGMWAFVIYDLETKELVGARDYFGIKPLYYYQPQAGKNPLLFGSEIKAFTKHPAFTAQVNTEVLGSYLNFGFVPGTDSMFAGVKKVPPGSYFTYVEGKLAFTRYHTHAFQADEAKMFDEWVDLIDITVKDSVKYHKISDVEVGSFLSSGIDSSYVAKLGNDIGDLRTFSVGYQEKQYSELPYAQAFAARYDLQNYAKEITGDEYFGIAEKVAYHLDEPLADPSCLSLYFVCKNAAEHVKVTLSGEGADELFAGYNPYRDGLRMDRYQRVPLALRKLAATVARMLPDRTLHKEFWIRGAKPLEERYFQAGNFIFESKELPSVLNVTNTVTPEQIVAPFYEGTEGADTVSRMQTIDLNVWMPGDILLKADKMSMANSLEARTPFLDIEILKLAQQIPARNKVSKESTKISLRAAARREIDDATAAKKKLGFPVPLRDWLRRDEYYRHVKEAFSGEAAAQYFNVAYLNKLLEDHRSGKQDTYRRIWAVYMFLLWHKQFIET